MLNAMAKKKDHNNVLSCQDTEATARGHHSGHNSFRDDTHNYHYDTTAATTTTTTTLAKKRQQPNDNDTSTSVVSTELLLDMVIRGHGDKLIGRWSNQPQLQQFLDQLPYLLDRIQQIHLAATKYSLTDFIMLIDNRQSLVRSLDQCGCTTLHKAIMFNNVEVAEYLIDCFGTQLINQQDKQGRSPLHYAATLKDKHLYRFLLAQNKVRIVLDNKGRTPMYYLEHSDQLQMKNLINLSRKLNANFQTNILSKSKLKSAQQYQQQLRYSNLQQQQHQQQQQQQQQQPLEYVLKMEMLTDNQEEKTDHPSYCSNRTNTPVASQQMSNCCKSNSYDEEHRYCSRPSFESPSLSSSLSSSSSSLSLNSNHLMGKQKQISGNMNNSHNVMSLSCNDLTRLESPNRSTSTNDPNVTIDLCQIAMEDKTAKHKQRLSATRNPRSASMSALLDEECQLLAPIGSVNTCINSVRNNSDNNDHDESPISIEKLHLAIINGDETIVKKLCNKHNRHLIRGEDSNGLLPLHKSVILGHIELSKQLVHSIPMCINSIDKCGRTALHYAAGINGESQRILTKFLIGSGINPCIKDNDGHTAEYYRIHSLKLPKQMNALLRERQCLCPMADLNTGTDKTSPMISANTTSARSPISRDNMFERKQQQRETKFVIDTPANTASHHKDKANRHAKKSILLHQYQQTPRNIRDRIIRCLRDGCIDKINELVIEGYGAYLVEQARNICWNLDCRQYIKQVIPKLIVATERLHELILKNDLVSMKKLLSYEPILIKIRRHYKQCAMNGAHFSCLHNRLNMIKFILDNFPEMIHLRDSQAHTCLHIAAKIKSIELYNILIEYGCSTAATDNRGYTAGDYFFDTHNSQQQPITGTRKEASASDLLSREQAKADEIHMTSTKAKLLPHSARFDKQTNKQPKQSITPTKNAAAAAANDSTSTTNVNDDDDGPDFLASTEEETDNNNNNNNDNNGNNRSDHNKTRAPIFTIIDQGGLTDSRTNLSVLGSDKNRLCLAGRASAGLTGHRLRANSAVLLDAPSRTNTNNSNNLAANQRSSRRFSDFGGCLLIRANDDNIDVMSDSGFLSKRAAHASARFAPNQTGDRNSRNEREMDTEIDLLREMTGLGLDDEVQQDQTNGHKRVGDNDRQEHNCNDEVFSADLQHANQEQIDSKQERINSRQESLINSKRESINSKRELISSSSVDDINQRASSQRTSDGSVGSPQSQVSVQLPMSRPGSASTINKLQRIIRQAIYEDDINKLEHIIIAGRGQHLLDLYDDEFKHNNSAKPKISVSMMDFFNNIAHDYIDKVQQIHRLVSEANLDQLKSILNKKRLALSRDYYGATPLHLTVVKQQLNIFEYLLNKYPQSMSAPDNEGRLPIHYAAICLNYHTNHTSKSDHLTVASAELGPQQTCGDVLDEQANCSRSKLQFIYNLLKERDSSHCGMPDKMGFTPDHYGNAQEPLCCERYRDLVNRYDDLILKACQQTKLATGQNKPKSDKPSDKSQQSAPTDIWRNEMDKKSIGQVDEQAELDGDKQSQAGYTSKRDNFSEVPLDSDSDLLLRDIPQESLSSKLDRLDTVGDSNPLAKLVMDESSALVSARHSNTDTDDDRNIEEPSDGRYCHLASPDNRPHSASSFVSSVPSTIYNVLGPTATTAALSPLSPLLPHLPLLPVVTGEEGDGERQQQQQLSVDDRQLTAHGPLMSKEADEDHLSVYKTGYLLDTNSELDIGKLEQLATIDDTNISGKKKRRASHHVGDQAATWKTKNTINSAHKVSLDFGAENDILPFITTALTNKSGPQKEASLSPFEIDPKNTLIPNKSPRQQTTMVGGVIIPSIMHNDNMEKVECYDVVYRRCSSFDQRPIQQLDNSDNVSIGPTAAAAATVTTTTKTNAMMPTTKANVTMPAISAGSSYFNVLDTNDNNDDDNYIRQASSDEDIERVERLSTEFENTVKREKNELKTRVDQIMNDIRMTAKSIRSTNNILTTNRVTFDPNRHNGRIICQNKQQQHYQLQQQQQQQQQTTNQLEGILKSGGQSPLRSSLKQQQQQKYGNSVRSCSISSSWSNQSSSTVTSTGSSLAGSAPSSASSSSYCSSCDNNNNNNNALLPKPIVTDCPHTNQQQQQQTQMRQNTDNLSGKSQPEAVVIGCNQKQQQHNKQANNNNTTGNSQLASLTMSVPVKNAYGQTYLHFISSRTQNNQTFYKILTHGAQLLAERDIFYRTMRDIAAQFNLLSNVQVIDQFIIDAFVGENIKLLKHLQHQGYSPLIHVADLDGNDIMLILKLLKSTKMIQFLQQLADFQKWRDELHTFIRHGYRHGVSILIKKHFDLVTAKSVYSRTSAHIATLFERTDILEELIRIDKRSIYCTDNMGRTALHYAYGIQSDKADDIRNLLIDAGSDEAARDVKMRTPKYYYVFKHEIQDIKKLEYELV